MKQKAKLKCTHCGATKTYNLDYYQSEVACKSCKKEQDIEIKDFNSKLNKGFLYQKYFLLNAQRKPK